MEERNMDNHWWKDKKEEEATQEAKLYQWCWLDTPAGELATDAAKKKSKKAAKSRKFDTVRKDCHKHNVGPRSFARIEYNMVSFHVYTFKYFSFSNML